MDERDHLASLVETGQLDGVVNDSAGLASGDLLALTCKDPAANGQWQYVLSSYLSYRAVVSYRIASSLQRLADQLPGAACCQLRAGARRLSEAAKQVTGVEIHPGARIGPRFVVDHGFGTVIGASTVIGADCYVLQGVVLGATGIASNPSGKRHPTLGDRVEVGGFARILGPVEVGDDVLIGPHALVTSSVPAGARVLVVNQYQVVR